MERIERTARDRWRKGRRDKVCACAREQEAEQK